MNLLELQRRMAEDVRRPLTDDFDMQQSTEDGAPLSDLAASYIKPNDRLSSFERLEIYNRQYWFRVIGAVSEDYPALNALLGEKRFDALVLAYLRDNPSTSWTLRDLGKKLPAWLSDHPKLAGRRHQLAAHVAALEWAYVDAFDGLKLPPLTAEDLQNIGPDTRLALQPHLQLLQLHYPVDELVLAVRRDAPETEIASNASTQRKQVARISLPAMKRVSVYLAVHRYDDIVYYRRIDREAFLMLTSLRDGSTLAEALVTAFRRSRLSADQQAEKIQATFAHAAELGWFCRVDSH
jgi:hypothetical protein